MGTESRFCLDTGTQDRSPGGFGVFYEPQGNYNTNIRQFRQPPFGFQVNVPINVNAIPTDRLADGFPTVVVHAESPTGTADLHSSRSYAGLPNGRLTQFNISAQRELRADMVFTLGFVGSSDDDSRGTDR